VLDEYGFRVRGPSNQRDRSSSSRAVRFDTFADAVFASSVTSCVRIRVACDSSIASGLEQLNRIAVGILDLNLFAAWAGLHIISKTQAGLFQGGNSRR
jgi:hypothetical protein